MVEPVRPLRVVTPLPDRPQVADLRLRDHEPVDPLAELPQDVRLGVVEDRVRRVEAEPVDAVVARPRERVSDRPLADAALRVVEGVAPEGLVAVGEVRAEGGERLRARADVVVDDVEDHAEPFAVRRVDEPREAFRPAVGRVRRVGVEAVVAPAPPAGKGRDGHRLDRSHAELPQVGEPRDHGVEGALGRERADVELVEHELLEHELRPGSHRRDLHQAGGAADPERLEARARVRPGATAVEDEAVVVARPPGHRPGEDAGAV